MCYAAVTNQIYYILYLVFCLRFTSFYTTALFSTSLKQKPKNKVLSLLYYLNDWYIIVEKLNYLQYIVCQHVK